MTVQNVVEGQETEGIDAEGRPIEAAGDQLLPSQVKAFPATSTATQKVGFAQERAASPEGVGSTGIGADQVWPFHRTALPCTSIAMQKVADGHEIASRPPVGRSMGKGVDQVAPFHVTA